MRQRLDMGLYLRRETEDGRVDRPFIMAKSRTARLQFVSVQVFLLDSAPTRGSLAAEIHGVPSVS